MSYLPLKNESNNVFPKALIPIQPGVHLMVSDGIMSQKTKRRSGTTAPLFELSYSRKSTIRAEVDRIPVEVKPGHALLGFTNETNSEAEYENDQEILLYSIWTEPVAFDTFCEAVGNTTNTSFKTFRKKTYCCYEFKSDETEERIIRKFDQCFAAGPGKMNKLLLESHVLELLSINIERLLRINCSRMYIDKISKTDMACLTQAQEIILGRLHSPPTLIELSHAIHMNDCKLKKTFKKVFGMTVYEFIRGQRLEKAFSLLQEEGLNVSEAAHAVGYTNLSHFSRSFQNKFGVYPSALLEGNKSKFIPITMPKTQEMQG